MALFLFVFSSMRELNLPPTQEFNFPLAQATNSSGYGAVTFVSSLPKSADKSTVASKMSAAGFGWAREEYAYPVVDFASYDSAYSKLRANNLQILGLLTYSSGVSHSEWKNYVNKVVGHFPGVGAWEVMNEADNYLSPADYAVYLKEANEIIKGKGSAAVICSGLSARKEVYPFWDGLKAAGAWDSFDAIGLHMFHDGTPFEDSYNNGTFRQEIQKVVNTINNNGGGKPIWITEMGYDSSNYGIKNQANWLVDSLKIAQSFSEVNKVFIFRAYDHGNGLGLLTSDLGEKEAYIAVKNWLSNGTAPAEPVATTQAVPEPTGEPVPVVIIPKVTADPEKTLLRLDGKNVPADSKTQYKIVITLIDKDGKIILDQKPSINLSGGQTELTDFVLIGNEWVAYVASSDPGERTAKISLGAVELGTVKMVFTDKISPTPVVSPPAISSSDILSIKNKLFGLKSPFWFYLAGSLSIAVLTAFLIIRRKKGIL